jgi:hypothetical protein
MARKKRSTTTYLVMVHDDGSPIDVLLPDGRMAILLPDTSLDALRSSDVFVGTVRHRRGGTLEIMSEFGDIDETRQRIIDEEGGRRGAAARLELRTMISFV